MQKNIHQNKQSLRNIGNIEIPRDIQNKIDWAIFELPDTEWSGVLFYSIKDRKGKISAVVKDILILDIGTSVHTQYDSNDVNRYIAAFIADNELEGSSIGLIHSHHRMGAFFSGEDMQTLASEGKEKNWFLSLVVDSGHTYEARITRKVVYNGTLKGSYTDPDGNTIYTGEKKFTSTQIETYSLDVKYPKSFLKFPESPLSTAREISRRKASCMTASRDWLSEHRDYESIIPYQPSAYMKSTDISRGIIQRASCQNNDIDTGVCKVLSGFLRLDNVDSIVSELIDEADSNPPYYRMWEDIDPKYKKREILEKVIEYICDYKDDSLDPILELVESKLKTL